MSYPRITSYNVCYTKLLRLPRRIDIPARPVGRERVCFNAHRVFNPRSVSQLFRITSYNVCYTKLLREELAIDTKGKASDVMDRIVAEMLRRPRVVIVDEIDTLLPAGKFSVLELFRDIHDQTKNVFLMVGMESCDARLKAHQHFYSRIVGKAKFQKIPKSDIEKFVEQCDVKIDSDLVDYFHSRFPNLRVITSYSIHYTKLYEVASV